MSKVELVSMEYEYCGECSNVDSTWTNPKSKLYCIKAHKRPLKRADLWGKIPTWCPLPDKVEEE